MTQTDSLQQDKTDSSTNTIKVQQRPERKGAGKPDRRKPAAPATPEHLKKLLDKFAK